MSETEIILDAIGHVRAAVQAVDDRLNKVEISTRELAFRERERNGHIADLTRWRETVEMEQAKKREQDLRALGFQEGEQAVKDAARNKALAVWEKAEKPVVYGLAAVLLGLGMRLGAFFIGGPW